MHVIAFLKFSLHVIAEYDMFSHLRLPIQHCEIF